MLPMEQNVFEFKKQFLKLVGGAFRVYDSKQRLLLFSEQKAFKLREDIRVFSDESKTIEVLSIKTQQIIDMSPTFHVMDTQTGEGVGLLKRKGWKSILKDEWEVMDRGGNVIGRVDEDSALLATLRRFLTNLIPQRYHITIRGAVVGSFQQNFNPFTYRAIMDLSSDRKKLLDRRLAVAIGILLMAIEGREG